MRSSQDKKPEDIIKLQLVEELLLSKSAADSYHIMAQLEMHGFDAKEIASALKQVLSNQYNHFDQEMLIKGTKNKPL